MNGLYPGIMKAPMSLGPVVLGKPLDVFPAYRSRFSAGGKRFPLAKEELGNLLRLPVHRVSQGYLEMVAGRNDVVGYEDGCGNACVADSLTYPTDIAVADHERVGSALGGLGYGHDDPTIARAQLDIYLSTLRGARKAGWISHGEYLDYLREAYEAGFIER